jgi:putative transposase
MACYRYIELNPVRAGMVSEPGSYTWSSHAANVGLRPDPMLEPHCEYLALANVALPHATYRGLFAQSLDEGMVRAIREATNGGYPLASEAFIASRLAPLGLRTQRGKPGPRVQPAELRT